MKVLFALMFLPLSAFAQTNSDITISAGGVTIVVRGTGEYVCSAQDSFKKKPRLGRGATEAQALENARFLAALTNNGSDFFVDKISCEKSNSGRGQITIQQTNEGFRVIVSGGSEAKCYANNSMHNKDIVYYAEAGTKTEAFALASNACTVGSNDNGFFCETKCTVVAQAPARGRKIKLPKIRL